MNRTTLWSVIVVLGVVLGACSGDDDGGGQATRAPEDEATGTETEAEATTTPSDGCDSDASGQADLAEHTMDVGGVARRYLLSGPAWESGDEALPLVVDFHGLSEGADIHAEMTQLGPMGVEQGFVTVFPHGTGEPVRWNVAADPVANPDLVYVAALLDQVEQERCIDTSRVYATGLSNGAMMSSAVACAMSDRFAAVAPVAGVLLPEPCQADRPVPVLSIHGTADPILLFNGGVNAEVLSAALSGGEAGTTTTIPVELDGEGYPATVRGWAERNGCEPEPTDEEVSDEVIRRTYDCPEDAPVEFLIVEGGGHSWPSSEFSKSIERIVGPTTFDIDASEEVWNFVKEFQLPTG